MFANMNFITQIYIKTYPLINFNTFSHSKSTVALVGCYSNKATCTQENIIYFICLAKQRLGVAESSQINMGYTVTYDKMSTESYSTHQNLLQM